MTKAEQFDKAWRLAFRNDDFSLVDQIYHPDYSAPDPNTGIVVNLEDDKVIVSSVRETYMIGFFRPIFESDEFVCLHRFFGSRKEDVYTSTISAITYRDGKILKQETVSEPLDRDPSEGPGLELGGLRVIGKS